VIDQEDSDLIETIICKIEINDLNDNLPVFDLKYDYDPKLTEDTDATIMQDRLIAKFLAIDLDGSISNSLVSYKIESVDPTSSFLNTDSFKLEMVNILHINFKISFQKQSFYDLSMLIFFLKLIFN